MLRVMVFGSGPAGLMAAHAVRRDGHDCIIVSQKRKTPIKGAQYLHAPIPGASVSDPFLVTYRLTGSADGYRQKVYGPGYGGTVSPEELAKNHEAWDLRETYDRLWASYGIDKLQHFRADLSKKQEFADLAKWAKPDLMISTVPAPLLCYQPQSHTFTSQKIWSSEDNTFGQAMVEDNTVICNGDNGPAWYRAAKIKGHTTVEWPYESKPPLPEKDLWEVTKPLSTNCNCRGNIHRMGRYGKWSKGTLSHSAYVDTLTLLHRGEQMALFQQ